MHVPVRRADSPAGVGSGSLLSPDISHNWNMQQHPQEHKQEYTQEHKQEYKQEYTQPPGYW
jgi:hypothetical protein